MTTTRPNSSLYTQIENKVATVEFGHPQSNSFPGELLERLTQELNLLCKNDQVNIILLKSEGEGAFCAGACFDELLALHDTESGKKYFSVFANVINVFLSFSKIIVGRIHGI